MKASYTPSSAGMRLAQTQVGRAFLCFEAIAFGRHLDIGVVEDDEWRVAFYATGWRNWSSSPYRRRAMFERLEVTNFRKFTRFSLRLRNGNILVGPNNSGKSSLLDAFRVLEACLRHTRTRNPTLIEIPDQGVFDGYEVPQSVLPFSLAKRGLQLQ